MSDIFAAADAHILLQAVLAVILGAAIGIERELNERPAGLRTHVLVSLGSAIFAIMSIELGGTFANIAAGIVTGIGFLGAGTILHHRDGVKGLTTTADLWVSAAIGLAVGINAIFLAIFSTILVLIVLVIGRKIDKVIQSARSEIKGRFPLAEELAPKNPLDNE